MAVLFIALLAGLLFLMQRYLYHRFWNKGIYVTLAFGREEVTAGEENVLLEVVENRKLLPLSTLKVKFQCSRYLEFPAQKGSAVTDFYYKSDLFSIMSYQRITRTLRLNCPKRGYYGIRGIDLVGADLFFSEEMHGHLNSSAVLYVLPRAFSSVSMDYAMQKINGEIAAKRHETEDPFTWRGIREYEVFDERKAINWKASAKTGELMVNIREHTAVKAVRIFLNLEDNNILRREELLEMSISICARMVDELLRQGIRTAVYANAPDSVTGKLLSMENNAGQGNLTPVYRALARLDLGKKAEDFESCFREKLLRESSLYTVIISPDRHEVFQRFLLELKESLEFCWLCPAKEPVWEDIRKELHRTVRIIGEEDN